MKFLFQPWVLILILLVVFILFAPKRLPDASKSMRKGMRAFKEEVPSDGEGQPDDASKSGDSHVEDVNRQAKP